MRQSMVNRNVLALAGVQLLACAGFAWVVEPPPTAAAPVAAPPEAAASIDGARLYRARCERCHSIDEALAPMRGPGESADQRAAYIAFLQRHRKSTADEDGPITDYLLGERERR